MQRGNILLEKKKKLKACLMMLQKSWKKAMDTDIRGKLTDGGIWVDDVTSEDKDKNSDDQGEKH